MPEQSVPLLKRCTKCGSEYPATPEYFHKDKNRKDGLYPTCKLCVRIYRQTPESKAREHARNKSRLLAKRAYNRSPRGKAALKRYRETEKYEALITSDEYKAAARIRRNKDQTRQNKREYQQRYQQTPKRKAYDNARQKTQHFKETASSYRHSPRGLALDKQRAARRRARTRSLPSTFTLQDWDRALEYFGGCCAVCGKPPGLWHILAQDHWVPVIKGGAYTPDNIVPLCHSRKDGQQGCNNTKKDRDAHIWLVEQYGERKATQIEKRIIAYFEWVAS